MNKKNRHEYQTKLNGIEFIRKEYIKNPNISNIQLLDKIKQILGRTITVRTLQRWKQIGKQKHKWTIVKTRYRRYLKTIKTFVWSCVTRVIVNPLKPLSESIILAKRRGKTVFNGFVTNKILSKIAIRNEKDAIVSLVGLCWSYMEDFEIDRTYPRLVESTNGIF